MPIFEYQCQACSERFEELVLSAEREAPHCPECGGDEVAKQISTFAAKANGESGQGSFSESEAPMCGSCGVPGPCAIN